MNGEAWTDRPDAQAWRDYHSGYDVLNMRLRDRVRLWRESETRPTWWQRWILRCYGKR
jgi:hypothetical protein